MSEKFISIITASNRPAVIKEFIQHINDSSESPESIQVLISVDTGDNDVINAIKEAQEHTKIEIKYLEGTRTRGYFSADHEYNKLLEFVAPETYFLAAFSDKTRIKTQKWDKVLRKYYKSFEDDFFRIKISHAKHFKYEKRMRCFPECENFAFHTKKYLELIGGWGDCWGSDSWLQLLEFDIEAMNSDYVRGIPSDDLELMPYDYSTSSNNKSHRFKSRMIEFAYYFFTTNIVASTTINFHVIKCVMYIDNYKKIKDGGYRFEYNSDSCVISLYDKKGKLIDRRKNRIKTYHALVYQLSPWKKLFKQFIVKKNITKQNDRVAYYCYKLIGMFTAPYFRIVEIIAAFTRYYANRFSSVYKLNNLKYVKFENGLEIISNQDIDDIIQKKYDEEIIIMNNDKL